MPNKYVPLPIPADLTLASLCQAAMIPPKRTLYVSYYGKERALALGLLEAEIEVDPTLRENEWYIVTAVGSNPP